MAGVAAPGAFEWVCDGCGRSFPAYEVQFIERVRDPAGRGIAVEQLCRECRDRLREEGKVR